MTFIIFLKSHFPLFVVLEQSSSMHGTYLVISAYCCLKQCKFTPPPLYIIVCPKSGGILYSSSPTEVMNIFSQFVQWLSTNYTSIFAWKACFPPHIYATGKIRISLSFLLSCFGRERFMETISS